MWFFLSLPPHSHSSALPLVSRSPLGKSSQVCQLSVNRCVLWVREMQVCGNLQTLIWAANKRHCHSELAASKNKYGVWWASLCSKFIIGRVKLASIVLMNPNPHSFPSDLHNSVSGNTQVWPLFHFICRQRVFSSFTPGVFYHFSCSASELSHWEITSILRLFLTYRDEYNPGQQTLHHAVVGTPLCIPYPRLRCSIYESCTKGEAVGERRCSFADRIFASTASPSSDL